MGESQELRTGLLYYPSETRAPGPGDYTDSSKEQLLKEGEAWKMGIPLICPALPCPGPAYPFLPAAEKLVEAKLEDEASSASQFGAEGHTISEGLFLRSPEAAAVV